MPDCWLVWRACCCGADCCDEPSAKKVMKKRTSEPANITTVAGFLEGFRIIPGKGYRAFRTLFSHGHMGWRGTFLSQKRTLPEHDSALRAHNGNFPKSARQESGIILRVEKSTPAIEGLSNAFRLGGNDLPRPGPGEPYWRAYRLQRRSCDASGHRILLLGGCRAARRQELGHPFG